STPETNDMMTFATAHHFVMSANFHGGAEVFNYPWDCWETNENAPADASWWEHVGRAYVDTARLVNSNYMTYVVSDGVTEGADWYYAYGSRQDYMNYFPHCKEVTIELSSTKTLSSDLLPTYWTYNKQSLLNYIKEAGYGFNGTVKNTSGDPLNAKIEITGYDKDSSNVVTDPVNGDYYRPIAPNIYTITYSSTGYISQNHTLIIDDWSKTVQKNVILEVNLNPHNLSGKVTEDISNNPIENVKIEVFENSISDVFTNISGDYSFNNLELGTYLVIASKNGYTSDTLTVQMTGSDVTLNFVLKPNVTITGTITEEGTGTPIENVKVEVLNTSIPFVLTNATGQYSINNVPQTNQQIKASKTGYTAVTQNVDISTSNTVVDFTLAVSNAISFESEVPSIFTFSGNADWFRSNDRAYDGDYSMKSGNITDNQTSVMQSELNITAAGNISFYKKVSSESGWDFLRFYIDDTPQGSWSGSTGSDTLWALESYPVTTGIHTFKWEYSKDGATSSGSDCAWVDYIEFPEHDTSGINNFDKSNITIFPNPSNGSFTIKNSVKIEQVTITDITGRLIKTINSDNKQVSVFNLNSGIYIVSIYSGNDIIKTKVIIK
ncbi:MAG: carboxypeptidase regulatory-like domain-containing protein, partial [Bacteroidales bacterium]|nr:carboxypeptidase regulatory-like domain-containing protein [Bacteroidales bacterium]